jgi:tetratricopeptide (TPR) repeat protein
MVTFRNLIRTGITAAVILTASAAPLFAQNCDSATHHYRAGSDYYAAGDYANAYASFSCFLELYPAEVYPEQTAEVLNMRGNALREQGDWAAAIEQYTLALEVQTDYAIAYNNRGWAQFNLGDYEAALSDYNAAISADPMLAYAYNNRGLLYQFQQNLALAASDFEEAISLGADPALWAGYNLNNVRLVEAQQGNTLLPEDVTTSTGDTQLETLLEVGRAAHDSGDWRGTVDAMTSVLALDPRNAQAVYLRGRSYTALDNSEAAFADFDQLVSLVEAGAGYPSLEYAYWERAIAYAEIGDFAAARADVDRATMIDPGHVNNFIARGTIAALRGDTEAAGQEFLGVMLCGERERIDQPTLPVGEVATLDMREGRVYIIPVRLEAGSFITISAISGEADPVIALLDPNGAPINGDDDSGFMLTSLIEDFEIDADGTYTLMVSHAGGGSSGNIAVSVVSE